MEQEREDYAESAPRRPRRWTQLEFAILFLIVSGLAPFGMFAGCYALSLILGK